MIKKHPVITFIMLAILIIWFSNEVTKFTLGTFKYIGSTLAAIFLTLVVITIIGLATSAGRGMATKSWGEMFSSNVKIPKLDTAASQRTLGIGKSLVWIAISLGIATLAWLLVPFEANPGATIPLAILLGLTVVTWMYRRKGEGFITFISWVAPVAALLTLSAFFLPGAMQKVQAELLKDGGVAQKTRGLLPLCREIDPWTEEDLGAIMQEFCEEPSPDCEIHLDSRVDCYSVKYRVPDDWTAYGVYPERPEDLYRVWLEGLGEVVIDIPGDWKSADTTRYRAFRTAAPGSVIVRPIR